MDCVLLNFGIFRFDRVYLKGWFKFRDFFIIFLLVDEFVVIEVIGIVRRVWVI